MFYLCSVAASLPCLAIVVVLVHYLFRRAEWKVDKRRGKESRFSSFTAALGMMLLFSRSSVRPTLRYVLEEKQDEDAEEDDQGDPEGIAKRLTAS